MSKDKSEDLKESKTAADFSFQVPLGSKFSKDGGKFIESDLAPYIIATVHPSAILRAPDDETRHEQKRRFIDELKKVAEVLSKS